MNLHDKAENKLLELIIDETSTEVIQIFAYLLGLVRKKETPAAIVEKKSQRQSVTRRTWTDKERILLCEIMQANNVLNTTFRVTKAMTKDAHQRLSDLAESLDYSFNRSQGAVLTKMNEIRRLNVRRILKEKGDS